MFKAFLIKYAEIGIKARTAIFLRKPSAARCAVRWSR